MLCSARADPNIRRAAEGDTALIKATQLGHAECMRVLLAVSVAGLGQCT